MIENRRPVYPTGASGRRQWIAGFWFFILIISGLIIYKSDFKSPLTVAGATAIAFASVYPGYLWCIGKVRGYPIFPVFALTHLWTSSMPLFFLYPQIAKYTPSAHLRAALTVAGFLALSTFVWLLSSRKKKHADNRYLALKGVEAINIFMFFIAFAVLVKLNIHAGWLNLPTGVASILRFISGSLALLGVFVLSYLWGMKQLKSGRYLFWGLIVIYMMALSVNFVMREALIVWGVALAGFVLGRKKIPWLFFLVFLLIFALLHQGKQEMREKYWDIREGVRLSLMEYPNWYRDWAAVSWQAITKKNPYGERSARKAGADSIFERVSIIQMLLLAQAKCPLEVPYLKGKTYKIIPQLLVPRIINPHKMASHEGTGMLSSHFGLQDRDAMQGTTIGWGLISESYVNYGYWGCMMLALIIGFIIGKVTAWSADYPILSFRALYSFILIIISLAGGELTAGAFVTSLFHMTVAVILLGLFLMKGHKTAPISKSPAVNRTHFTA